MTTQTETRAFEAEVQQVLHLMVHSLYSNAEIFIRELTSNAADALDKRRFLALSDDQVKTDAPLAIQVTVDAAAKTVTFADNGIGMSRDEVIENIGTIARSGTKKFMAALEASQRADAELIGQFGVGFYSAFIVARQVELTTRRAGEAADQGVRWRSDGQGEYQLDAATKTDAGTEIIVHLKDDAEAFAQVDRVRSVLHKYSDHIAFPIELKDAQAEAAEFEQINEASALWRRNKTEISDEEYQAFYKHVAHDFDDALTWAHNRVEGAQSYTTLLYVPKRAPFDLFMNRDDRKGLRLYVRRVFIMDAAERLLPNYLRFMRGVVDSDDLPLNVSREILQENALLDKIKAAIVKRSLNLLAKLQQDDAAAYASFWSNFGEVLKEGAAEDFANQEKVARLLRFASTRNDDGEQNVSLDDYLAKLQGEQDKIYYLTADSYRAAANSPHLEAFKSKGLEVLLMFDRVDEWMMGYLREFEGKSFVHIGKGEVDLSVFDDDAEKARGEAVEKASEGLVERLQTALQGKVGTVRASHRLTAAPARLILAGDAMAMHMQRMLAQAGHELPPSEDATLEINPDHALVKRAEGVDGDDAFAEWATLIYEQAMIAEGGQLEDPAGFIARSNRLLLGD